VSVWCLDIVSLVGVIMALALLTLVPLLLALDADCEVLASLPVDLVTLGVVVDEVAAVAVLLLVEVGLGDGLVGEELVLVELEDQTEAGAVEVLHADVGERLERSLVAVCDHLGERDLVLHGAEPELGDALDVLALVLVELGLGLVLVVLIVLVNLLADLDLVFRGLRCAVDDLRTGLVEGRELGEVLLLELQDLFLELGLELGVLLLDALEAGNATADGGGQRLDVATRAADERAELVLHHGDERGVGGEEAGGGALKRLWNGVSRSPRQRNTRGWRGTQAAATYLRRWCRRRASGRETIWAPHLQAYFGGCW
jgi:hypothetical protein